MDSIFTTRINCQVPIKSNNECINRASADADRLFHALILNTEDEVVFQVSLIVYLVTEAQ